MARYTKDNNGNLILTAGGTRIWVVTQAAHDRAVSAGTAPNNCVLAITDDYYTEEDIPYTEYEPDLSGDGGYVFNHGCYFQKKNGIVQVGVEIAYWDGTVERTIYTLPQECAPSHRVQVVGGGNTVIGTCHITVTTSGDIQIARNLTEGAVDIGCFGVIVFVAGE